MINNFVKGRFASGSVIVAMIKFLIYDPEDETLCAIDLDDDKYVCNMSQEDAEKVISDFSSGIQDWQKDYILTFGNDGECYDYRKKSVNDEDSADLEQEKRRKSKGSNSFFANFFSKR